MAVVSGDIIEITFNHPTIGTGTFFPKAGEDSTFDPGGFRGNDDANLVDGGGRTIRQLNRVRWSYEGDITWDMNNTNEVELINQLAASPVEATWTISHINGTVWGGKGAPVGDVQGNGNNGTITLKIAGGEQLKKIVG
jgi:hypothetical protein